MAANDDATLTFDTVSVVTDYEWKYPDRDGITERVVSNTETLVFALTAASTGTRYTAKGGAIGAGSTLGFGDVACSDGTQLTVSPDPNFTWFVAATDATTGHRVGAMRVRENDGYETDWDVTELTINNVDEPTEITSATFTAKDGTNRQFFWGSTANSHPGNTSTDAITVAQ